MNVAPAASQSTTIRVGTTSPGAAHGVAHMRTAARMPTPRNTRAKTTPSGSTR